MRILIAYISKTGTTEEIARKIGDVLKERAGTGAVKDSSGARIDALPISEVDSALLQDCDRIILGSPINGMKVLPEFKTFVT